MLAYDIICYNNYFIIILYFQMEIDRFVIQFKTAITLIDSDPNPIIDFVV